MESSGKPLNKSLIGCSCSASRSSYTTAASAITNAEESSRKPDSSSPASSSPQFPPSSSGAAAGMIYLPGGMFLMGTNDQEGFPEDGEGPIREIELKPFYISPYVVTNQEFAAFIANTGYRTEAEVFGWSYVFHLFVNETAQQRVTNVAQRTPWWWVVEGADWAHPEGPAAHTWMR